MSSAAEIPTWSKAAEDRLTLRRMSGDKNAQAPKFWPGRPNMWAGECPIAADGQLAEMQADALEAINRAVSELLEARKSSREFVERSLTHAEAELCKALKLVSELRQRIVVTVPADFGEVG
jgi:hypothetical protein